MADKERLKQLRETMVQRQLVSRGIRDKKVLKAMREVPRDNFVAEDMAESAYDDHPLPIGEGQTISQPYMVALMSELLQLRGKEKVLEIGTGSGYQTAVLARLSRRVFTIDRIDELIDKSRENLSRLNIKNVEFLKGDGTLGWKEFAPYDRIIVTAGSPEIPDPLVMQLAEGGIMVIPVGDLFSQTLKVIRKQSGKTDVENTIECVFVKLIGRHGWGK
ncbi:MAG: protein-L-isoaspartate(D-aspartate) O-methyltransferase [Spirochaetes bacterium]|nr:protein-L-isoaspartate(D-aspartate) O-methyltransferase [Spirochaetota bacterium]